MAALDTIRSVTVAFVAPTGDQEVGTFSVADGKVSGTDRRGVTYAGTVTPLTDGADVTIAATVPAGTEVNAQLSTEEEQTHTLRFQLDAGQLSGQHTKELLLPGLGAADVRFTPAS